MSDGSLRRRTEIGLIWIVMSMVLAAPGCAQLPIPRSHSNQVHLPKPEPAPTVATKQATAMPSVLPELVSLDETDAKSLPPLPSDLVSPDGTTPEHTPTARTTATATTTATESGSGTNAAALLDAALVKAEAELVKSEAPTPSDEKDGPTGADSHQAEDAKSEAAAAPEAGQAVADPQPSAAGLHSSPKPENDPGAKAAVADPKTAALRELAAFTPAAKQGPIPIDPEKPIKPVDPDELWNEGISRLQKLAGEQARGSSGSAWTRRSHLLRILAEDSLESDDKGAATRPSRMALAALGIPHEAEGFDTPLRGSEIRAAVTALEAEAPLEISELQLCRKVNGFGSFDPMDSAACKAGQPLIVYCELAGLHYSQAGELFHSRLSSRVELVPSHGGNPVWAQALGSAEDVCRHRRRDYYVNYRIVLPETIPPAVYELRVVQTDEVAGHSTSASIPLTIQP